MKICSTFHGFVLDLRKKVLENVLRECSQFCCGEDPIVSATKQRAFAKCLWASSVSRVQRAPPRGRQCFIGKKHRF